MGGFRDVPGYEGHYEVNEEGVVRSIPRSIERADGKPLTIRGRIMKPHLNNRGYLRVTLTKGGVARVFGVHQIVALAFLPKPRRAIGSKRGQFVTNHKDGDRLNNRAANLEYITSDANVRHARARGLLSAKGIRNNKAKLTDDDVRKIRDLYSEGRTQVSLADEFGVDQTSISRIVLRTSWAHIA